MCNVCAKSVLSVFLGVFSCVLQAGTITPTMATESGHWGPRVASHTIDGSGLDLAGHHSVEPDGDMWLVGCGACSNGNLGWIQWDLGQSRNLTGFHLWNYNEQTTYSLRGVQTADILISLNGTDYTNLGSRTFVQASGAASYTGEDYVLATTARYVKFNITSNFNAAETGFVGLSEIRFTDDSAVPEPASMGLLALGGAALLGWRKSRYQHR